MPEVGWPEPAFAAGRTASTRSCCPSSRQSSTSFMATTSPFPGCEKPRRLYEPQRAARVGLAEGGTVAPKPRKERPRMPDKTPLQTLSAQGQSVWLDYLSRQILQNGHLAEMMERDAVVGVTSNPTIFQKAIAEGDAYDDQLRDLLDREQDGKEIFLSLSAEDVKQACKLLRRAWDGSKG